MLNKKYESQPSTIASYDYVDVEEGAGMVNYMACKSATSAASTYFMTRNAIYSDTVYSYTTSSATTATAMATYNFDIEFQSPKTMANATAYAILALGMGSDVTTAGSMYAVVSLKKGTTTIVTATSRTITREQPITAGQPSSEMVTVPLPTGAVTHFKIGDTLRMTVVVWGFNGPGSSFDYALGHDPKDRVDPRGTGGAGQTAIFEAEQSTTSSFLIPWRMDV